MNKLLILIFIFLFIANINVFAQGADFLEKKDPLFASILSWYIPGAGLIYSENLLKGVMYLGLEYFIIFYGLTSVVKINYTWPFHFEFIPPLNPDSEDYFNIAIWGSLYLAVHITSIIDSAISSEKYNKINQDKIRAIPPSPFIASILSWSYPGLGQFYIKDYFKGSIFMLIDFTQKLLFYIAIYSKFFTEPVTTDTFEINWNSLTDNEKIFFVSYIAIYILNRITSAYFAYIGALQSYKYYSNYYNLSFQIIPAITENRLGVSFIYYFN
ncbi:MAG: hypothetical protein ACK4YF_07705 [Exilispira sp.]